jgi:hypothetical protein
LKTSEERSRATVRAGKEGMMKGRNGRKKEIKG